MSSGGGRQLGAGVLVYVLATLLTGFIYAGLNWPLYARVIKTAALWYLNIGLLTAVVAALVRRWPLDRLPRPLFYSAHVLAAVVFAALWTAMAFLDLKIHPDPQIREYLHRMPHQYFNIGVFVYAAVAGWLYAMQYHRRTVQHAAREAELTKLAREAEIRALKAQINPHFLFNTLNTVNALARDDPETARTVNAHLGDLIRYSLECSERETATLGQELDFVRGYLAVEKARLGERASFSVEIAPGLEDVRVPPMILQPLVENAVRHGVASRPRGGMVSITLEAADDKLRCRIRDDGPGVGTRTKAELLQEGVGLRNVDERLQRLYGSEASLTIEGQGSDGCTVTLVMPLSEASS